MQEQSCELGEGGRGLASASQLVPTVGQEGAELEGV